LELAVPSIEEAVMTISGSESKVGRPVGARFGIADLEMLEKRETRIK
jgi:hypothetical protein